jgi:hypothetical protein
MDWAFCWYGHIGAMALLVGCGQDTFLGSGRIWSLDFFQRSSVKSKRGIVFLLLLSMKSSMQPLLSTPHGVCWLVLDLYFGGEDGVWSFLLAIIIWRLLYCPPPHHLRIKPFRIVVGQELDQITFGTDSCLGRGALLALSKMKTTTLFLAFPNRSVMHKES